MSEINKEHSLKKTPELLPASELAAGLLYIDRYWLIPIYLLLSLPALYAINVNNNGYGIALQITERILELVILFFIGLRWIPKLRSQKATSFTQVDRIKQLLILVSCGLMFWLLIQGPAILLLVADLPAIKILAIFLWPLAVVLALAFYFYFFPILLGYLSLKTIANLALYYFKGDRLLAIKTMLAPMAIMLLAINIMSTFTPDSSIQTVLYGKAIFGGLFFVLSSYLVFAVALVKVEDRIWREFELDPYREARFSTLRLQGPSWLAHILLPGNGLKILFIAVLLGLANLAADSNKPPTAKIVVEDITIKDRQVTLFIRATDQPQKMTHLMPQLFSLAGPEGQTIGSERIPIKIISNGEPIDPLLNQGFPALEQVKLELTFEVSRNTKDLVKLEDLYLWYRQARLELLDMSKAQVLE